jgi:AhpD family alkylhydroperoxidase
MTTHTDSPAYVPVPVRLDFDGEAPVYSRAVSSLDDAATEQADIAGVDPLLRELVRLRASQLNGCAYCVDMHSRDARAKGATNQRVDAVAIWQDSGFFTAEERAALALAESITRLSETHVPEHVLTDAVAALGEQRTAAVIALVVTVGVWNAIGVSTRCWSVPVRRDR